MDLPQLYERDMVNRIAILDPEDGSSITLDGPFEFEFKAGGEVRIPVNPEDYAGISEEKAESVTGRVENVAVIMADDEIVSTGVVDAADIIEKRLLVRVDDPQHLSLGDVDASRPESADKPQ